jgi:hypothetical protein
VTARLQLIGIAVEESGLELFDPQSAEELSTLMQKVLSERRATVERQQSLASRILSYSWKETSELYLQLFAQIEREPAHVS